MASKMCSSSKVCFVTLVIFLLWTSKYGCISTYYKSIHSHWLETTLSKLQIEKISNSVTTSTRSVNVYLLDSGVDKAHPEISDQVRKYDRALISTTAEHFNGEKSSGSSSSSFSSSTVVLNEESSEQMNTHGTSMASIIVGKNIGICKDLAQVIVHDFPINSLEDNKYINYLYLEESLAWILENHQAPAVINLSVQVNPQSSFQDHSSEIGQLIKKLQEKGVIIVVSAGNSNIDACGSWPWSNDSIIRVGAIDSQSAKTALSNFGACVDLYAPGSELFVASTKSLFGYDVTNGTSGSAAFISGCIASLLTYLPNEQISCSSIKSLLLESTFKSDLGHVFI